EQDDKGWDARKRAYCLKIQPATGSFARNLIYSTKPPFIDNVFMQQKLVPEIACYVDEDTAMAGLVSIDYGIAIMPRITALSYYNVHILKIKNTIPPRYIYLATMKDKGLSPALESFKNVVIHDSQKIC
ncbi:LysR substrate-binding domain-containing protein, partial [Klebsiella pneumoniae]|uniref:LysR substrate-binding domain-containing protein n=1 Tax=Klebsiella pneumoniae TaxID=573 RepID=UPI0021E8A56B